MDNDTTAQAKAETDTRVCTCHPDDNPPRPCPRKFAYRDCVAADLGRRIEARLQDYPTDIAWSDTLRRSEWFLIAERLRDAPAVRASTMHEALTAANLEYSALSWAGFNLYGDRASIEEAKRMQHLAGTVPALQDRLVETQRLSYEWMRKHDQLLGFIQDRPAALKELIEADPRTPSSPVNACPRPVNTAPEGKTAAQCIADGECGCDEDETHAWEYWHGRAMAAEAALHQIRTMEPGTQEYVDGKPIDAAGILGDVFLIARSVTSGQ